VGKSYTVGSPNVFGGQVVAQALNAAYRTITNNRILHSMHAYFLEPGDLEVPIDYKVTVMRDGGSFSVRRVTALQNDTVIFILACSFHKDEPGYNHQTDLDREVPEPESLQSWTELLENFGTMLPGRLKSFLDIPRPVEFKPTYIANPMEHKDLPPRNAIWFKFKGDIPAHDLPIKQQLLSYVSDYNILGVTLNPHASELHWGNAQTASLDHSMWFFRDFEITDWLLYSLEAVSNSNARGFARGNIYTREGILVASVAQEGLIRPKDKR
ncbi:acyl-CoA thioesterase, partial [Aegicerativicinus sediminis]